MDSLLLVSLFNAGIVAVAILGCLLLYPTPAYRGVCLLLVMVITAAVINVLEDQHLSRDWHLISPVFVLGFGPALYLAIKRVTVGPVGHRAWWHFVPMIILLPFTAQTQAIIAIGTLWRVAYALLSVQLIMRFNRHLSQQRSDAAELSLTWLAWLVGLSACFSALDLLRLNMQPELSLQLNMLAYAASTFVFLLVLLFLVVILNHKREGLQSITDCGCNQPSTAAHTPANKKAETGADYQSLFSNLDQQIRQHRWFSLPRLSLHQLSELSGMSTRDISRSINLAGGLSFNDYINRHRIEHIKHTLAADPNTNLTKLAFSAGFSSKATFNQSFKKMTGTTPSAYRCHLFGEGSGLES